MPLRAVGELSSADALKTPVSGFPHFSGAGLMGSWQNQQEGTSPTTPVLAGSERHTRSQLLFSGCLLPKLLSSPGAASAPSALGCGTAGRAAAPTPDHRSGAACSPASDPNRLCHFQFPAASLIHLISYSYATGKVFLARSVLRQLKPNGQLLGSIDSLPILDSVFNTELFSCCR